VFKKEYVARDENMESPVGYVGELGALEVEGRPGEVVGHRDAACRQARLFGGLTRGVVDLEDAQRARPRRLTVGKRVEARAQHHQLLDTALARLFEAVLGVAAARHHVRA
jgi:hypothetical protein